MFSNGHFIWLGISFCTILIMLFINSKFKFTLKTNIDILLVASILSQLIIIFTNMNVTSVHPENGIGYYLEASNLPLHLCSVHIFLFFALKFFVKNENTVQKILCFMAPTMLIGGFLALIIPTEGASFNKPHVYEYFLYHSLIIYFAIYLIKNKLIKVNAKVMFENLLFLSLLVIVAIWINSVLSDKAVNFMFMARPPMEGLPVLNMNHGWFAYFCTVYGIGIFAIVTFHLPFILNNKKED